MVEVTTIIKKTGYAALGLPGHIIDKLRERLSSVVESAGETRQRLMLQVQDLVDESAEEGERMIAAMTDKPTSRTEEATDMARERIAAATDLGRGVAATVTTPAVPVEQIDGVGPIYADELATAGITTTRALLERCHSERAIERLADRTGIGVGSIAAWVADADLTRIGGIGTEHMNLLNAIGIGAVSQLAKQDPRELRKLALDLDDPERGPIPSENTFGRWIDSAKDT